MSDKGKVTPLDELARGSDLGRRLAKLEDRLGGRASVHWTLDRWGLMHCRQGASCKQCPPVEYRSVGLSSNGYVAMIIDTRPALELTEDERNDRACALGYTRVPGAAVDPTACTRCGRQHPMMVKPMIVKGDQDDGNGP